MSMHPRADPTESGGPTRPLPTARVTPYDHGMELSDGELLRELKRAVDAAAAEGTAAQAAAVEATLRRYGATMADVARALGEVRRRRKAEIAGLAGRLEALASTVQDAADTANAADQYLRKRGE